MTLVPRPTWAHNLDRAAMQASDALYDSQSQACSTLVTRSGRISSIEPIEYPRQVLGVPVLPTLAVRYGSSSREARRKFGSSLDGDEGLWYPPSTLAIRGLKTETLQGAPMTMAVHLDAPEHDRHSVGA